MVKESDYDLSNSFIDDISDKNHYKCPLLAETGIVVRLSNSDFIKHVCGIDDVLLLILVHSHVLNKNQPGTTLALLGRIFYRLKTKLPRTDMAACIIPVTSLL